MGNQTRSRVNLAFEVNYLRDAWDFDGNLQHISPTAGRTPQTRPEPNQVLYADWPRRGAARGIGVLGARGFTFMTCGIWGNMIRLPYPLPTLDALFGEGVKILEETIVGVRE
jgi:hypothetical protein